MPKEVDALSRARALIEDRLKEVDEERTSLEAALKGLAKSRLGPGRPRGSTRSSPRSNGRRRRRRRRGGTRAEHALKAVQKKPGITAAEIADELKIKPNYVYRVMSDLTKEGKVKKDGRTYKTA